MLSSLPCSSEGVPLALFWVCLKCWKFWCHAKWQRCFQQLPPMQNWATFAHFKTKFAIVVYDHISNPFPRESKPCNASCKCHALIPNIKTCEHHKDYISWRLGACATSNFNSDCDRPYLPLGVTMLDTRARRRWHSQVAQCVLPLRGNNIASPTLSNTDMFKSLAKWHIFWLPAPCGRGELFFFYNIYSPDS